MEDFCLIVSLMHVDERFKPFSVELLSHNAWMFMMVLIENVSHVQMLIVIITSVY